MFPPPFGWRTCGLGGSDPAHHRRPARELPGLADRWRHLARPGRRERRDIRSWARRGAIRARQRRDIGLRRYRDVRATRWGRVFRAWSGRLRCFRWRRRLLHGPGPSTSAGPAGRRPGCPAAGSPAWCPGWGSAPAPGCRGPPRPADGSHRRSVVRRNSAALRDLPGMTECRPQGGPPALVPQEVDRAAPAAAFGRAAAPGRAAPRPPHSPRGGRQPSEVGRRRPLAGRYAGGFATQIPPWAHR